MTPPRTRENSVEVIDHPSGTVVRLEGDIDETFNLDSIEGPREVVVLDVDGVKRINSVGVKRWRVALGKLDAKYVCFVCCQPALVAQFNVVPEFACGGELVSLYLPYVCPQCDQATSILLDLRKDRGRIQALTAPEVRCQCGAKAEFDDFAEYYLRYAREAPIPCPPAAAEALLDDEGRPREP